MDVERTARASSGATPPRRAARPRRRHFCATQGTPHRHRRRASRAAAQRIMTQRAPQVFELPATCVRLCHTRERPAPASCLHRRVHLQHSSPQRPKGQPSRLPKGSTGRQEKTDEDYRTGSGAGARRVAERHHHRSELASRSLNTARWPAALYSRRGRRALRYHQ